jgi:hypothetical protein
LCRFSFFSLRQGENRSNMVCAPGQQHHSTGLCESVAAWLLVSERHRQGKTRCCTSGQVTDLA